MVKKQFFTCLYALCLAAFLPVEKSWAGPGLVVNIDMESARANIALLSGTAVTDQQLAAAADLYGNRQLIVKVKGYSGAGKDVFIRTMKEIITTGTIKGDDPYDWRSVKAAVPAMRTLINSIDSNRHAFIGAIVDMIAPYTPPGLNMAVNACFLAGGGALGFTMGSEKTFYVALQKLGREPSVTRSLVAHELYHIVQQAGQDSVDMSAMKKAPYHIQASLGLLENLWSEGTANLAGDAGRSSGESVFEKEQTAEWSKNAERRRQNFVLFEAILYKCFHDTAVKKYDEYYNICFTTAFDETSYFTGYEMAKAIVRHKGKEALAKMVLLPPVHFIDTYIQLSEEVKDDRMIRFDASTRSIIQQLKMALGDAMIHQ